MQWVTSRTPCDCGRMSSSATFSVTASSALEFATRQGLLQWKQPKAFNYSRVDSSGTCWGSPAFQDNALAAVPEIPHLHGPDKSILEIVVRLKLLPLQQLLSCVNSRALD